MSKTIKYKNKLLISFSIHIISATHSGCFRLFVTFVSVQLLKTPKWSHISICRIQISIWIWIGSLNIKNVKERGEKKPNLMDSLLAHVPFFHQVSWKSIEQFLHNPADKQTNKLEWHSVQRLSPPRPDSPLKWNQAANRENIEKHIWCWVLPWPGAHPMSVSNRKQTQEATNKQTNIQTDRGENT